MSELSSRPRASDHFYDVVGRRAFYTPCHSTVDLIFTQNTEGGEARIYQGGYARANDVALLNELSIGLVVNVSANIPAPEVARASWSTTLVPLGGPRDTPRIPCLRAVVPLGEQLAPAKRERSDPLSRRGPSRWHVHGSIRHDGVQIGPVGSRQAGA